MGSVKFARSRASVTLALLLATASLATAMSCKPKKAGSSATPAASGSAAAASGPCGQYAEKVCAKTGPESPTCTNFKEATGIMSDTACNAGIQDIQVTLGKLAAERASCDKLVQTLCTAIGPATKTCTMVKTQTANFPPARCKAMAEHTPQIIEDLKKMEAQNQPLSPDLQAAISSTGPAFGPENSKVKIVEFSDFECPFCSRAASVVHQIREKYGDKVRFVFREYPLPMHQHARGAAEAALAANAQGKFWEYHDKLFANQQALDRAGLEGSAKSAGLDVAQFKKALDDKKFSDQVESDMKLGQQVQVQGTPTMFVNGERVDNPTDFSAVASMIDAALGHSPHG